MARTRTSHPSEAYETDSSSHTSSPISSPQSPPENSLDGSVPLLEIDGPALKPEPSPKEMVTTLHMRDASMKRVASISELTDTDDENDEVKEEKWSGNQGIVFHKALHAKGMIAMKEPLTKTSFTETFETTIDDTTFTFGSSRFDCNERPFIEAKYKEKARKAFADADLNHEILRNIGSNYSTLSEVMTPLLKNSKKITRSLTTKAMLNTLKTQEESKSQKTPKEELSTTEQQMISLIHEYSQERQPIPKSENTSIVYRQPNAVSYDPMVFLPFTIPVPNTEDSIGLKISAWGSGGTANTLTPGNLDFFQTFILARCIGGPIYVGVDINGGHLSIIKHNIQFFEKQKIVRIKVLGPSFYDAVQGEIFKKAVLPLMQQLGQKSEKNLELKSAVPEDNELKPHHLSVYLDDNHLYCASLVNNTPKRYLLKKTDFGKHPEYYDALATSCENSDTVLDSKIKEKLIQIAMWNDILPRDFRVIVHIPYIDYIMFGVRLYVEGCMTKHALGAFCYAILNDVKQLKKHTHRTFSRALGIELVITTPFENLFDTEELFKIFDSKDPSKSKHAKSDEMSNFVLEQLGLSTNESDYNSEKETATPEKTRTDTGEQPTDTDEEQKNTTSERQAKIVKNLMTLLMKNKFNPSQAEVWRDFIQAAEAMNNTPETLEDLFKIANAVVIGEGSYSMAPNTVCSIQPYSEKPIQTTFDKYSQKANEFSASLIAIPEGKEISTETLIEAEKNNRPILIQKTKTSPSAEILTSAQKNNSPILIKKGDEYSVRSYQDGHWQETKLDTLTREELTVLNKLKATPNSKISNAPSNASPLLDILRKGHNGPMPESANDIHYVTLADEYYVYGIKDNKWQETKLTSFPKEKQLAFNKAIKEGKTCVANEELKPFKEYIKKEHTSPAKYPYVFNVTHADSMAYDFNSAEESHTGMTFYYPDLQNKAISSFSKSKALLFAALKNGARSVNTAIPLQHENALNKRR